jgi:hypothetical protein
MFLTNKIIFIILFFSLFFNIKSPSQDLNCESPIQKQSYIYKDDVINLIFETNKINFCQNDTLKISVQLQNISKKSIYLLNNYEIIKKYEKDGLIIDFGGRHEGHAEFNEEMILLNSGEIHKIDEMILINNLIVDSFKSIIKIGFDFGLIFNLDSILRFIETNNRYEKKYNDVEFKKNSIIINSWLINLYFRRIRSAILYIHLNKN